MGYSPTPPYNVQSANLSDVANAGTARFNLNAAGLLAAQAVATYNINIASAPAAVDGFSFVTSGSDIVLLTAQTTASQNGTWVWNGAASALTRPTDFAHGAVVTGGRRLSVANGSIYAGTIWNLAVPSAGITVDTTSLTWTLAAPLVFQFLQAPQSVSACTNVGTAVTYTVPGTYTVGEFLTVTGITGFTTNNPNGTFVVTSTGAGTVTVTVALAPTGSYSSGGTVNHNFTPPTTGTYRIETIGGGGSGGGAGSPTNASATTQVGGGGGGQGEALMQLQTLTAGTQYLCTIGAGGASPAGGAGNGSHAGTGGNSGGQSTFAGTSNIVAAGGGGGPGSAGNSTTDVVGGPYPAGGLSPTTAAPIAGGGGGTSHAFGAWLSGGAKQGSGTGGGSAGQQATATNGGAGGPGGSYATASGVLTATSGGSGTSAGTIGGTGAQPGGGGGGGGGGAGTATSGAGGAGGPGGAGGILITGPFV